MKKQFKRSSCILFMVLLTATMLSACSAEKKDEAAPKQEVQQTEVAEQEVQDVEVKEEPIEEELVAETEPNMESEPEPEPETIAYEGIDMESTLPGVEWINTFEGIIDEPKFVVFNDETNKKVIIENGDKVEISTGDVVCVYKSKADTNILCEKNADIMIGLDSLSEQIVLESIETNVDIEVKAKTSDGDSIFLSCTLLPSSN